MRHQENPYIVPVCEAQLEVLHEDKHLVVINKPSMLLSTPGRHPLNRDSVIRRIQQQHPEANLVHRLDFATSGIMLIPLNRDTHVALSRQFQQRQVEKFYSALLYGHVEKDQGEIDLPIICDWERRPLQKICHETGKASLTDYIVEERMDQPFCSRVLFKPITGRSHQLRIHSREIGHPILGCEMYAHDEAWQMAERLMLHACRIIFQHPASGEQLDIVCPAPF